MQGHSGSGEGENLRRLISTSKQAIHIKRDTTVGHFYVTLTLTLQSLILRDQLVIYACPFVALLKGNIYTESVHTFLSCPSKKRLRS